MPLHPSIPLDSMEQLDMVACTIISGLLLALLFLSTRVFPSGLSHADIPNENQHRLPPGPSWVWPTIGETLHLIATDDPDQFFSVRRRRYGDMYTTHLFGAPTIAVTTPDMAKFVLQSTKFRPSYFKSFMNILGRHSILTAEKLLHAQLRRVFPGLLTGPALHDLIPLIDKEARSILNSWASKDVIQTLSEGKRFTFAVILRVVFHDIDHLSPDTVALRRDFGSLIGGLVSIPIDIPGSAYSKALKARKRLCACLQKLLLKRRQSLIKHGQTYHRDLLNALMTKVDEPLNDKQIIDNLISILFAGHESSSMAICSAMHVLYNRPDLMKSVQDEHNRILKEKSSKDSDLTADDLKKMTLTLKIFHETLRIANIAPYLLREAAEDVGYAGHLIPKNWKVIVNLRQFHLDPNVHTDPLNFNPDRFESSTMPNSFMPWGNGPRICAGIDLAKQQFLIFIHRLISTYS